MRRTFRRLARPFQGPLGDAFVSITLVCVAFIALTTWPDHVVADFAVPIAIAIGIAMLRRWSPRGRLRAGFTACKAGVLPVLPRHTVNETTRLAAIATNMPTSRIRENHRGNIPSQLKKVASASRTARCRPTPADRSPDGRFAHHTARAGRRWPLPASAPRLA